MQQPVQLLTFNPLNRARAQGHGCEANIEDSLKRDCYPDTGASEETCRARDCVWCPVPEPNPENIPWCFIYDAEGSTPGPLPGYGCEENYLPGEDRVDCAPGEDTNEVHCRNKNCTWCPYEEDGVTPWCYIPGTPTVGGYNMVGEPITITNGLRVNLIKAVANESFTFALQSSPKAWEGEAETLTLDAEFQSNYRLRVKIYNTTSRFEVPLDVQPATGGNQNPLYEIEFENDPLFSFKVVRKSTGTVLFDSSAGQFIYAEQYLTMSWNPASENVYGIGENEQKSFKHDFSKNITWGLWGRDQPPSFTANMYGVQPYYTVLETDGNSHSVAVVNANAQQFSMLGGASGPIIKYITTGGVLDFYFFLGPTPENTVQQYTEAVGRPQLPPYWALGFQLCRYGYNNIANMKAAVDRTAAAGIPQDVQYGDIDIMHKALDFTYSRENFPGLPEYIKEIKTKGIKFMTILDPCISIGEDPEEYRPLKLGNEMDVWVKNVEGVAVVGRVWPQDPVHFPDYSKNATKEWWKILIREFHDLLEYDGLWIDMNEPANFVDGDINGGCTQNNLNNPPFVPQIEGRYLPSKTICGDHKQEAGNHYDVHSLYGWFQSEPTLTGTREGSGKRALVLSRSTFLGSGHWVAHWLGDNWSKWDNLHYSIIGILQYNQFGVPFAGSDICGFIGDSNAALCQRWMELGAFYPFSRNHNGIDYVDQDPGAWGAAIAESSKNALLVRYTLLPYLYTLFFRSVTEGNTVARALWHQFPADPATRNIDRQFMWGSGLLVTPVLDEGAVSVDGYFPDARFFNYFDGSEQSSRGESLTIPTPMDKINLHIVGGNVLPTQEPALNTELSRNNPFGLIVALDDQGTASGSLFFDDGDSIGTIENEEYFLAEFTVTSKTLTSTVVKNGYPEMSQKKVTTVRLLGAGPVVL
ncbi:Maltase-glucoamylase, intestinal [Orchesella cincta]|uniref:Maltase-glucoamylase, intestinal n=1 Tax=Orchesella cincta TaxID=48709 RepID=A0A1D2MJH6_ORCCI|nr:Maltase-glucoamylase, intestinal [Orchesella cincta]